ncbi:MAG: YkvA family protein [Syntrophothermus sp.]
MKYQDDDMQFNDEVQFTEFDELDFGGKKETDEQIKYVENNFWTKLANAGKKINFSKHVVALFRYMKDPFIPIGRKALVAAGLFYFIIPFDTMPDFTPLVGYLDDLGVIAALVKFLGKELVPYYRSERDMNSIYNEV